ncbi:MAG TPA: polyphenol oxidase family protein [Acidimicrobiia bacterium]|nr:polyphenol oxidase family protein [Acidimicrobiia bacterium]
MIRSEAIRTVAFGTLAEGDGRKDPDARRRMSSSIGIPDAWATITQVHGATVLRATAAAALGQADGVWTAERDLPIVVATADCVPVAIEAAGAIGLVHAGWRGVVCGVVPATIEAMAAEGHIPERAVLGPHIGPCCYEVGGEVIAAVGGHASRTTWGTVSLDLAGAIREQLEGMSVDQVAICTRDDDRFSSHRRDGTTHRQVTVAWR